MKRCFCACLLVLLPASVVRGELFDQGWKYRRPMEVVWDADHGTGRELATADFYAPGISPPGADLRVTQNDGTIVPSHVLTVGPGDRVRLVFALAASQSHYFVYFGNPSPPPPPEGTADVHYTDGLRVEYRALHVSRPQSAGEMISDWDRAGPVVGEEMVENFFSDQPSFGAMPWSVSKWTGCLSAPVDGNYFFAGSSAGGGLVCIDGRPAWFIANVSNQARFNITLHLKRGWHDFVLYGGDCAQLHTSIAWRLPGAPKLEVIPRNAFGVLGHARVGALQEAHKTFTADFEARYLGQAYFDGNFSHRYRFTAFVPPASGVATVRYDWDFGDGQSGGGAELDHVYLTRGVYPVKLTLHLGIAAASQVTRLGVERDWAHLDMAPDEPESLHGRAAAGYDAAKLSEACLPWMVLLEQETGRADVALAAARRMARIDRHPDAATCLTALKKLALALDAAGKSGEAADLWGLAAAGSDLQPDAAAAETETRLWWLADFGGALKATQKLGDSGEAAAQNARGMALVMSGRGADGRRVLQDLQQALDKSAAHAAAMSGAMARTVEYRVAQGDWETGDREWDTWQARCPADFLEGYSVVLRVKLMELQQVPTAAADVAAAFAAAVADSPYAPQLLDMASRILAKSDPARSAQLRQRLQDQYPEDPLSQQKP